MCNGTNGGCACKTQVIHPVPKVKLENTGFTVWWAGVYEGKGKEIECYEPHGWEYIEELHQLVLFGHEEVVVATPEFQTTIYTC